MSKQAVPYLQNKLKPHGFALAFPATTARWRQPCVALGRCDRARNNTRAKAGFVVETVLLTGLAPNF